MDIDRIAKLARLELTPNEKEKFGKQLENILSYFKMLDRVNTDGLEPLLHGAQFETFYREDVVQESLNPKDLFKNAPKHNDQAFLVSKVVE